MLVQRVEEKSLDVPAGGHLVISFALRIQRLTITVIIGIAGIAMADPDPDRSPANPVIVI